MKHSIILFALLCIVSLTSLGRDRLYIEDFDIAAGETLQVPVILLNDTAYCGLQTDLYLPPGLSLDMEYDEYIIDLTSRKHSSHTVASRQLSDGAIRIYISSISAREFSGNSGPIMTLSITAANTFSGHAVIELKNSICAEAIGTRHVLGDEICNVNPNDLPTLRGDVDGDSKVNIDDVTALINILLRGDNTNSGADADLDGKVNIDDVTALINYLLTGRWPEPEVPQPETFTINGVTFTMVPIEGGTFSMGCTTEMDSNALSDEMPVHQVTLSSYYMGQTEVTQELWEAVMGSNPSHFNTDPNCPVENVSWNQCQEFIAQLNALTGKSFRLPTEAEWEYAARGGKRSNGYTYAGSNDIDEVGWYKDNSGESTHPVGMKKANELGLFDMTGNVCEWCFDRYGYYTEAAQTNPTGPETGSSKTYRGGSWQRLATNCRIARRNYFAPTSVRTYMGLRLVL